MAIVQSAYPSGISGTPSTKPGTIQDHQRIIPIHVTTASALEQYLRTSRRLVATINTDAFFVNSLGHRPHSNSLQKAFSVVRTHLGYQAGPGGKPPRLHDLRHAYATTRLLDAYHTGADVDARVAEVATYLGHVSPESTYWYLTAIPELMHHVADNVQPPHQEGPS